MFTWNFQYVSRARLAETFNQLSLNSQRGDILIRIHTAIHTKEESVELAGFIKEQVPGAHIFGTSTSAVIIDGKMIPSQCVISVTQMTHGGIYTAILPTFDKNDEPLPVERLCMDVRENAAGVDTKLISWGRGNSASSIILAPGLENEIKSIEDLKGKKIQAYEGTFMYRDLIEYLKLGGRLSAAAAAVGSILRLKPVLTIEEGIVKVIGKARGSRNSENMLIQFVQEMGGIDFDRPVCLGYTGFDDAFLQKYIRDSAFLYEGHEECLQITSVGATIGTYAGPGAIALAFFAKGRQA